MAWKVEFQKLAAKQLRALDRPIQQRILTYFRTRVLSADDPRQLGKALTGDKGGLWRYRVGDCRAICKLEEERLVVLVLELGHRREVYR
ncbi:MAG TPA: type II toxin-antitoxin system RelE/ParE family toxin [Terriglobales bacterium]